MSTGWKYVRGRWYYLDKTNGDMKTGWYKDGSTWYYLDPTNGDMKTGWIKVGGNWYYLNSSGAMVTGSQTIDGKVYNFASSGEWILILEVYIKQKLFEKNYASWTNSNFSFGLLATNTVFADDSEGWQFVQENGRTYYKKGDIKETDWRVIDGKTYYFDYNGEMVVGWQYIPMPVKDIPLVLTLMV